MDEAAGAAGGNAPLGCLRMAPGHIKTWPIFSLTAIDSFVPMPLRPGDKPAPLRNVFTGWGGRKGDTIKLLS
jgi:hypothetical protein